MQWRDYALDKHRVVDDAPYGGGAGMVLKCEPLFRALEDLRAPGEAFPQTQVIYLTPQGEPFTQTLACELARDARRLVLVCGHYEGVDQRACDTLFAREISIGDYVLTGGELAAAVVSDAVARLLPGCWATKSRRLHESHMTGIFDHPHYTRPEVFRDLAVPPLLLGGHHAKIEAWRRKEALRKTLRVRPDLIAKADLSKADRKMLEEIARETLSRTRRRRREPGKRLLCLEVWGFFLFCGVLKRWGDENQKSPHLFLIVRDIFEVIGFATDLLFFLIVFRSAHVWRVYDWQERVKRGLLFSGLFFTCKVAFEKMGKSK